MPGRAHFYALDTRNHELALWRFRFRQERDRWVQDDTRRHALHQDIAKAWQTRIEKLHAAVFYWRPFMVDGGGTGELWHPAAPNHRS
jgi:hypothetical protein